jgi:hypothetical protein
LLPGPYCILSIEAVGQLRKLGFKARRLEDGPSEWKAAGLPPSAILLFRSPNAWNVLPQLTG